MFFNYYNSEGDVLKVKVGNTELSKRVYLPGVFINCECPECSQELTKDLGSSCLDYPIVNEEVEVTLYCDGCDIEVSKKIIIRMEVEILN